MSLRTVTGLANEWGVSEYEVFRRAHDYYYGQPANPKDLEKQFGAWTMNHIHLPYYVLYFIEHWIFEA